MMTERFCLLCLKSSETNCVCLILTLVVQCGNVNKRSPITSLLTADSDQTINEPEENLSAYFEPFGSALVPNSPGNRDSIASCESDSLLVPEKKDDEVRFCFNVLAPCAATI